MFRIFDKRKNASVYDCNYMYIELTVDEILLLINIMR